MAVTHELITSTVLGGSASSVTISGIPSTFRDLLICASLRYSQSSNSYPIAIAFNGDNGPALYSRRSLQGWGSSGTNAAQQSGDVEINIGEVNAAISAANTFTSVEIYIPDYALSSHKPIRIDDVQEDNAGGAFMTYSAGCYRNSTPISSIKFQVPSAYGTLTLVAGSSFYVYGIKNS